jgi:hypothetical protein
LQVLRVNAGATALEYGTVSGGSGDALVANPLSQFAATTSAQLAGVISDETGSGALVFATSPTLITPALGVATATSLTASGTVNANTLQLNSVDLYTALMTNLRITDMGWTTAVVTGTGSTSPQGSTTSVARIDSQTGATAGSTFVRSIGIWGANDNAAFHETQTYSRPVGFMCSVYRTSTSTNAIARFLIANQNTAIALGSPGFGFEIRNERIWVVAHDGTTLTQLDTGVNWYTGAVNLMRCESNGAGSINLLRGNTSIGTITGGPTGTFPGYLSVSGTNGADSSSLRFQYNRLIYVRV